jgi:hypothetical protein
MSIWDMKNLWEECIRNVVRNLKEMYDLRDITVNRKIL